MGGLTSNRKRVEDPFCCSPSLDLLNFGHRSKKLKVSEVGDSNRAARVALRSSVYRSCLYPEVKELPRVVHAPTKNNRFALRKRSLIDKMGNFSSSLVGLRSKYAKASRESLETFRNDDVRKGEDVTVFDDEVRMENENVTEESSIEEMEVERDIGKENRVCDHWRNLGLGVVDKLIGRKRGQTVSSSVMNMEDLGLKALSLSMESDKRGKPLHEQLLHSARKREPKLQDLSYQILLKEKMLHQHQLLRPQKKVEAVKEDEVKEAFVPLSDEDVSEVKRAFAISNRREILVSHEKSNIDITGETLQCLRPGAWLNDEVINLYLELLKERENRGPDKFLKCHFLNTFFYKKLIGGKGGYNFQAVRRWTTQRKLGYTLSDCDKIFVPIHQEIHWCLAVINKKDQKFQYLDSLGGRDYNVMKVLAMYYADEVKDKTGKNIDVGSWEREFLEDLPVQENGYDCGVFMIKYADFYSRGVGLRFNQEHMPYFRQRTAKEILRLKAE
ncbi:protease [Lithospermum erythrorhizon]|uniref:Protease n=1 Tax=Lithospermum erythrorhizon TaxID=34254 RepID=A0AAV3Q5H9_LITER